MIGNGRLESQITALGETLSRRLKRLRESTLDVYADLGLKNIYRDWDTFDPELYPVANYVPPLYQDKRLRGETIPLYQNEYQLKVIRDKSRVLCALNEYAICGIENRKNYIIGTGLTYTAYPRDPNLAKHRKLCSKLQDFLDLADDYADLDEHAAEDLERQDEDGESFTRLFFKSNGMTEVRFIEPEYVCSPHGMTDDPQTSFGIITPPDDTATAEAYTVGNMPYPKVPTNWEEIPASEIVHNKNRSKKANKRGVPLFTPAMNKLKRAEEMLDSLSTMAKARAKIALIRQITGLTQDTATRLQTLLTKVRVTDPYTNEVLNIDQLRNGTILTTNQNGGYQFPSANVEANQFVEVLQAELRGVAGMLQMPEWMLTAVADAKYSNAFVVEGTAYRAFTRIQNKICKRYGSARFGNQQSVIWRMVKHAIEAGLLPYEVLECCRIEAAGPTLKTRNDAEEANTNKTYIEMGVRSKRTVQERIGDDPDTENAYLLAEQQQKNRERVAESPQAILQIQTAYTKGEIARPAAVGLAMTVYGFTSEDCDKLFPMEPGKDLTAAGNKPQQPPGGLPGGIPGGPPTPDTADQGDSVGNPLDTFSQLTESTIRVGSLSRHTRILLREAGFTGTVTAKNGAVFYYEDGKRVANPNKKEGPKKAQHHTADKAKEYQARAKEALDFALQNPEKLTSEHLTKIPTILAVLPKSELQTFARRMGEKVTTKYKQDLIDRLAKIFPAPEIKPDTGLTDEQSSQFANRLERQVANGEITDQIGLKSAVQKLLGREPSRSELDQVAKKLGHDDWAALLSQTSGKNFYDWKRDLTRKFPKEVNHGQKFREEFAKSEQAVAEAQKEVDDTYEERSKAHNAWYAHMQDNPGAFPGDGSPLYEAFVEARKKNQQAENKLHEAKQVQMSEIVKRVFGDTTGSKIIVKEGGEVKPHHQQSFEAATGYLSMFTHKDTKIVPLSKVDDTDDGRAYFLGFSNFNGIYMSRFDSVSVFVHEIAHHIEVNKPGVSEAMLEFRKRRTEGKPPVKLRDVFPNSSYADSETGNPDDWEKLFPGEAHKAYYVGKEYGNPFPDRKESTEVFSMGCELLHRDPIRFAKTDPEYFDLIVNSLYSVPK